MEIDRPVVEENANEIPIGKDSSSRQSNKVAPIDKHVRFEETKQLSEIDADKNTINKEIMSFRTNNAMAEADHNTLNESDENLVSDKKSPSKQSKTDSLSENAIKEEKKEIVEN
jgi:hypothetical protein